MHINGFWLWDKDGSTFGPMQIIWWQLVTYCVLVFQFNLLHGKTKWEVSIKTLLLNLKHQLFRSVEVMCQFVCYTYCWGALKINISIEFFPKCTTIVHNIIWFWSETNLRFIPSNLRMNPSINSPKVSICLCLRTHSDILRASRTHVAVGTVL